MPPPLVVLLPLMCAVAIVVYFIVAFVLAAPFMRSSQISRNQERQSWNTSTKDPRRWN